MDGTTAYEFSGDGNGAVLLPVLTNTLMDFIKESTGGEFSNWSDIFSNLGDLEGLTEQFQNGGLEGLPIEYQNVRKLLWHIAENAEPKLTRA